MVHKLKPLLPILYQYIQRIQMAAIPLSLSFIISVVICILCLLFSSLSCTYFVIVVFCRIYHNNKNLPTQKILYKRTKPHSSLFYYPNIKNCYSWKTIISKSLLSELMWTFFLLFLGRNII